MLAEERLQRLLQLTLEMLAEERLLHIPLLYLYYTLLYLYTFIPLLCSTLFEVNNIINESVINN